MALWVLAENGVIFDVQSGARFYVQPFDGKAQVVAGSCREHVTLYSGTRPECQDVLDQIANVLKPWRFGYPGEGPKKEEKEPVF